MPTVQGHSYHMGCGVRARPYAAQVCPISTYESSDWRLYSRSLSGDRSRSRGAHDHCHTCVQDRASTPKRGYDYPRTLRKNGEHHHCASGRFLSGPAQPSLSAPLSRTKSSYASPRKSHAGQHALSERPAPPPSYAWYHDDSRQSNLKLVRNGAVSWTIWAYPGDIY